MDWQPIETAPKDGRPLLVWMPEEWSAVTARWDGAAGDPIFKWQLCLSEDRWNPACFTHWMPLPEPPEQPANET